MKFKALVQHLERFRGKAKRSQLTSQVSQLSARLAAGVQAMLEGRPDEALQAALKYSAALEQLQLQTQQLGPPSMEMARANQVASLCWSLTGNRLYF